MAWGTAVASSTLTLTSTWQPVQNSGGTGNFSAGPTSDASGVINLTCKGKFQASPSNNINVAICRVDSNGVVESPDEAVAVQIPNTATPDANGYVSVIVPMPAAYEVQVYAQIDGSTDTTDTLNASAEIG